MHYDICGLIPWVDENGMHEMSGCGFHVKLYPEWKELVAAYEPAKSGLRIWCKETMGPAILKACKLPSGLCSEIRVEWGEWGPEHIAVPGNACGLDIEIDGIGGPRGGAMLNPHNVDSFSQCMALLCVFTWFADAMALEWELSHR